MYNTYKRRSESTDAFKGGVLFFVIALIIMAPMIMGGFGDTGSISDTLTGDAPLFSCVEYNEMYMTCRLGG